MEKSIIRTNRAGVFYAEVIESTPTLAGVIVKLKDCRRLWYWDGAASLSQLAMEGVTKPGNCKFTVTVPEMMVVDVIEILPCTEKAVKSIDAVPVWKM